LTATQPIDQLFVENIQKHETQVPNPMITIIRTIAHNLPPEPSVQLTNDPLTTFSDLDSQKSYNSDYSMTLSDQDFLFDLLTEVHMMNSGSPNIEEVDDLIDENNPQPQAPPRQEENSPFANPINQRFFFDKDSPSKWLDKHYEIHAWCTTELLHQILN